MTAVAADVARPESTWRFKKYTLKSGKIAFKGAAACLEVSSGKVVPASATTGLVWLGTFVENVDASAADKLVNVDLIEEIEIRWFVNGTSTDAVAATDVGKDCYFLDDQTVSILRTGKSLAGKIVAFDSTKGVGIQKYTRSSGLLGNPSLTAFAAGTTAPTDISHDAVYDVPTTAANSTIVLPTAAADGTRAYFFADGTKNGHTIQYVDQAGTTNITTALTASKRHLVTVLKLGGKWAANAYVSP